MTQNMRSPGNGFLGNIAKELMVVFNEFVYNDSIKKLNVKKNDNVIEIGSGNGQGIKKLLSSILLKHVKKHLFLGKNKWEKKLAKF